MWQNGQPLGSYKATGDEEQESADFHEQLATKWEAVPNCCSQQEKYHSQEHPLEVFSTWIPSVECFKQII
jgi:hypothetical protein